MKINMTIVGNLTADPELRFTANGLPVANFTLACTDRKWDKETNEYVDSNTVFVTCSVWRKTAENVAESLQKGMQVVAVGSLRQNNFEDKQGAKQTRYDLECDVVAASLNNATASITRFRRDTGAVATTNDPWATANTTEPPF